jgi:hypothetical protein
MESKIIELGDDFWNIRGSFKIGGIIDIGTQASLVRRANGKFVFLDSCALSAASLETIDALTDGGNDIEAILNVHPFHTVHVTSMHERYPHASLYGTARHRDKFPELPWQSACTEDPELHALFADDFEFSVPSGVDFISANENIHFSSVLVFHRSSKTIHVDDTLMLVRLPVMRWLGMAPLVSFHPTLAKALQRRAGAAGEFRQWAEQLAESWQTAENLCAAHLTIMKGRTNSGKSISQRVLGALDRVDKTLAAHDRKYG